MKKSPTKKNTSPAVLAPRKVKTPKAKEPHRDAAATTRAKPKTKSKAKSTSPGGRVDGLAQLTPPPDLATSLKDNPLLAEAARRARDVADGAENLFAAYGEWLFVNLFHSDTKLILDAEIENPLWTALLQQADKGKLKLSRSTLSSMIRVAAYDKRLADGTWSALSYSMKVALLPLRDPKLMRDGARHVLSASCTIRQAKAWVENTLRPERGAGLRLSASGAQKAIGTVVKKFTDPKFAHKVQSALLKLPEKNLAVATEGIEALIERLQQLLTAVKKR